MTFIERVRSDDWRHAAVAWIDEILSELGMPRSGPVEQPRARPWSTQLIVPVAGGRVWFKASCPGLGHEPALHDTLARLAPDDIDQPLGIDPERHWLLTRDRGPTLKDRGEASVEQWCDLVRIAAALQRRLVPHEHEILASRVPDCRPSTISERYEVQLAALSGRGIRRARTARLVSCSRRPGRRSREPPTLSRTAPSPPRWITAISILATSSTHRPACGCSTSATRAGRAHRR